MAQYRACVAKHACVRRSGYAEDTLLIDASHLLPGDIVLLAAGELVPADLRIISGYGTLDARTLLPNAIPHFVSDKASHAGTEYADSACMLLAGSRLTSGQCEAVAVHVGKDTVLARLVGLRLWPLRQAASHI